MRIQTFTLAQIITQVGVASHAASCGDLAGASSIASAMLAQLDQIDPARDPATYWHVASDLQHIVDLAEAKPHMQMSMIPALEGQLTLF